MVKINRLITPYNRTVMENKRNMWIVIHYVGAVSSAKANALYFYNAKRNASASYFVDPKEIWQVVDDKNAAWHVGAKRYFNSCRNTNSIGIEMCCKKENGKWYFEPETVDNTLDLATMLMLKYNIPIERVCRHYDVTRKKCPEPYVRDEEAWQEFLNRLEKKVMDEKLEKIKEFYGFDDNTIRYFEFYRYGTALIDKLYIKAREMR
jgi:N-acetylmuramoyl-L-alanine amidase CwlA